MAAAAAKRIALFLVCLASVAAVGRCWGEDVAKMFDDATKSAEGDAEYLASKSSEAMNAASEFASEKAGEAKRALSDDDGDYTIEERRDEQISISPGDREYNSGVKKEGKAEEAKEAMKNIGNEASEKAAGARDSIADKARRLFEAVKEKALDTGVEL